jgi:hypothetical protein
LQGSFRLQRTLILQKNKITICTTNDFKGFEF